MKTCTRCKVEKPLTEYTKNTGKYHDNRLPICKECMRKVKKKPVKVKKERYTRKVYQCEFCQEFFQLVKIGDDSPWDMSGKFCTEECHNACLGGIIFDIPDRVCKFCGKPTFNYFKCSACIDGRVEVDADLMMGE